MLVSVLGSFSTASEVIYKSVPPIIKSKVTYKLKDENEMLAILIKYKNALSKKAINDKLGWENDGLKDVSSKMLDSFYEIFPHPYHA